MKHYAWNSEKNEHLKQERGISFEDVVFRIEEGDEVDLFEHLLAQSLNLNSMRWLKPARVVWALPCSILGLVFVAVTLTVGGKARWSAGALEVTYRSSNADCGRLARALPFRGIVFGHVILAVTQAELDVIGAHERVHVEQYERWGPLFFLAYGVSSLWQLVSGRDPYWHNYFEIQARERSAAIAAETERNSIDCRQ